MIERQQDDAITLLQFIPVAFWGGIRFKEHLLAIVTEAGLFSSLWRFYEHSNVPVATLQFLAMQFRLQIKVHPFVRAPAVLSSLLGLFSSFGFSPEF